MKKSLLALAVVGAFAAPAMAQSSVTLFGTADVALQNRSASGAGGFSATGLGSSGLSSSALGFRGTEDLGGGLRAGFWFEGDIRADNGTGGSLARQNTAPSASTNNDGFQFNRRSTLSLEGGFGEIRLGRDFNPVFRNVLGFDPFGTLGVGASSNLILNVGGAGIAGASAVRTSNTIQYFTPNFSGFQGIISYAFGEQPSNAAAGANKSGNFLGLRLGYAAGPLSVAYAYAKTDYAAAAAAAGVTPANGAAAGVGRGNYIQNNLGVSYNFGVATAMFQWNTSKMDNYNGPNTAGQTQRDWLLGVNVPVGAGNIRASYINSKVDIAGRGTSTQLAIGYVHNLSRRTALYATYAQINNGTGMNFNSGAVSQTAVPAVAGNRTRGYDFGIRHSF